jgi:uncharacterized protein (TIRG00374 family)
MTDSNSVPKSEKKTSWLRLAFGLLISALALWVILRNVDLMQTYEALQAMDPRYLIPALILFLCTIIVRSLAWRTILGNQITLRKAFFTENEGFFLNNVLPFRLGEVGRAIILNLTSKLSFWEGFSTIIIERFFDMAIMAGLLLTTIALVSEADWALDASYMVAGLVVIGFLVLFMAARSPETVEKLFQKITARLPRLQSWGSEKLQLFLQGLKTLQEPKRFFLVVVLLLVTWIFNISWYWVLLKAFVPEAKILWAAFSVGIASLGIAVPSTPGYLGVYELATVSALALFAIPESDALAYALVSHALYLVTTIILGFVGFSQESISVKDIFQRARLKPAELDLPES